MHPNVLFGADRLARMPDYAGSFARVGLLTNDAARSASNTDLHTRIELLDAGVPIVRLFGPEHGLGGDAADGARVGNAVDALTGLPVISLYGAQFAPTAAQLEDLDAVLFDVPDVGARFYTYAWTLTLLIDACADAGIPVIVLDRPNPLSGLLECAEGPMLPAAHYSFIGRHNIPVRHSMTLGELALLWRAERRPDADVRVVACENWQRAMLWPDTGLDFVPTSPAIRCFEAALLYPALVFFEATNVSVGRGTALSFQSLRADWLDATRVLADAAGVELRVSSHELQLCVTDAAAVRPVSLGLALLRQISQQAGFEWRGYSTAANPDGANHLEKLLGSSDLHASLGCDGWGARCSAVRIYD